MHHRTLVISVVALALSVLAAACAADRAGSSLTSPPDQVAPTAPASTTPVAQPSGDASYPAPEAEATATLPPYPSPEEQALPGEAIASPKGTPVAGKGHAQGMIINRGPDHTTEPLGNRILYLAQMLPNTDGAPSGIVRVDENSAPMTVTDGDGRFVFENVEPGYYALAIKIPRDLLLARDVNNGEDVLIEVKAGEAVAIGVIIVSLGGEGRAAIPATSVAPRQWRWCQSASGKGRGHWPPTARAVVGRARG